MLLKFWRSSRQALIFIIFALFEENYFDSYIDRKIPQICNDVEGRQDIGLKSLKLGRIMSKMDKITTK